MTLCVQAVFYVDIVGTQFPISRKKKYLKLEVFLIWLISAAAQRTMVIVIMG